MLYRDILAVLNRQISEIDHYWDIASIEDDEYLAEVLSDQVATTRQRRDQIIEYAKKMARKQSSPRDEPETKKRRRGMMIPLPESLRLRNFISR